MLNKIVSEAMPSVRQPIPAKLDKLAMVVTTLQVELESMIEAMKSILSQEGYPEVAKDAKDPCQKIGSSDVAGFLDNQTFLIENIIEKIKQTKSLIEL